MKALTLTLVALFAVALVGCGNNEEINPATPAAPPAPEKTSWWRKTPEPEPAPPVEEKGWFEGWFKDEPEPAPAPPEKKGWF
jgi:hypothetical protein